MSLVSIVMPSLVSGPPSTRLFLLRGVRKETWAPMEKARD